MKNNQELLEKEAERATEFLKGKVVKAIWRHSERQFGIEFLDGTRLFIDHHPQNLELSIT